MLNDYENIELCSKLDTKTVLLINTEAMYKSNESIVCRALADITGNSVLAYYRDETQVKTCYLPTTDEQKTQIHIELILDSPVYSALSNNLLTNRNRFDYVANYSTENAFPFKLIDIFAELTGDAKIMQFPAIDNENSSFVISSELIPESIIVQSNDNIITRNIKIGKYGVKRINVPYIFALNKPNDENVVDSYEVVFEPNSNTTYNASIKKQGGYKSTNPWFVLFMILIAAIVVYLISRICKQCMCICKNNLLLARVTYCLL